MTDEEILNKLEEELSLDEKLYLCMRLRNTPPPYILLEKGLNSKFNSIRGKAILLYTFYPEKVENMIINVLYMNDYECLDKALFVALYLTNMKKYILGTYFIDMVLLWLDRDLKGNINKIDDVNFRFCLSRIMQLALGRENVSTGLIEDFMRYDWKKHDVCKEIYKTFVNHPAIKHHDVFALTVEAPDDKKGDRDIRTCNILDAIGMYGKCNLMSSVMLVEFIERGFDDSRRVQFHALRCSRIYDDDDMFVPIYKSIIKYSFDDSLVELAAEILFSKKRDNMENILSFIDKISDRNNAYKYRFSKVKELANNYRKGILANDIE